MYQANKMKLYLSRAALNFCGLRLGHLHTMCIIVGLAWGFSGLVQAQTILDYSRVQRAVLEAEMAKNSAKALGLASTPAVLSQSPPWNPGSPSARPPPTDSTYSPPPLMVNGAIVLASRALAEVQVAGVSHYLSEGDLVPGTHWSVSQISARQVTLAQGRPGKRPYLTRSFQLPFDPKNISPNRTLKRGQ